VFGYSKREKENKLLDQTMEIIVKALVLEGYPSDEAMKVATAVTDLLHENIGKIGGSPCVLAVRGMSILRNELIEDNSDEGTKGLVDTLRKLILDWLPNARKDSKENYNSTDLMILDAAESTARDEYAALRWVEKTSSPNKDGKMINSKTGKPYKYPSVF